jgi:hypothetical protein
MAAKTSASGGFTSLPQKLDSQILKNDSSDVGRFADDLKELIHQAAASTRNRETLQMLAFKLLNRIFGEEIFDEDMAAMNPGWVSENASILATARGGWLRRLCTRSVMTARGDVRLPDVITFRDHGMESLPIGTRKLISLLLPRSEFLAVMTSGRFQAKMKLMKLPVKGQICIRQFPYYECVRSPNQIVYFPPYFHTPSTEQAQPLLRADTNPAMMLNFVELFFMSILRFPKDYPNAFELVNIRYQSGVDMGPLARSVTAVTDPTNAVPGMLFGRLAQVLHTTPWGFLHRSGIFGWIDGSPYLVLLYESLKDFVPHGAGVGESNSGAGSRQPNTPGRGSVGSSTPQRGGTPGGGVDTQLYEKVRLSQAGELFLRLMAEFWIDVATLVRRNHGEGASFKAQLNKTVEHFSKGPKHPHPTEILTLDNSSMRWESSTMQCIYLVLVRILSDLSLPAQFEAMCKANAAFAESPLARSGGKGIGSNQANVTCPPALHVVQQPLFDMLRVIFAKAQQLTGSDRDMYALAVEVWLLYLQPWKAPAIAKGTPLDRIGKAPELCSASYRRETWLPYIASNLHFYTSLLPCFIQACSRVDLSATEDAGMVNLLMLEKVLVAFDPIKDDVEALNTDFQRWYPTCSRDRYSGVAGGSRGPTNGFGNTPYRSPAGLRGTMGATGLRTPPAESVSTSAGLLVAMRVQHQLLFPDPAVDRDVPYCGILDLQDSCGAAAQKLIGTLHVAMKDVSSRKGGIATVETIADVVDHLLAIRHWGLGPGFCLTRLVQGVFSAGRAFSNASHVGSQAVLSDRLRKDVKKIDALLHCGLPNSSEGSSPRSPRPPRPEWADTGSISAGLGLHDDITGALTPQGKEKLRHGHKLAVDNLRWFDDVLLLPYCSFEVHALAHFFTELSKKLNEKYDLPQCKPSARWPWRKVMTNLLQIATTDDTNLRQKAVEAQQFFRFNLRFLAGVRVACPLAMAALHYVVPRALLGWIYHLLMLHLAYLTFVDTTELSTRYLGLVLIIGLTYALAAVSAFVGFL